MMGAPELMAAWICGVASPEVGGGGFHWLMSRTLEVPLQPGKGQAASPPCGAPIVVCADALPIRQRIAIAVPTGLMILPATVRPPIGGILPIPGFWRGDGGGGEGFPQVFRNLPGWTGEAIVQWRQLYLTPVGLQRLAD